MSEETAESPQGIDLVELAPSEVIAETQTARVPFAYARRHGVVLTPERDAGGRLLASHRSGARVLAMAELRRIAGEQLAWSEVGEGEFEALLERCYARDASEARQMVEDLGDELDLARLADQVPETEDLLEQEDDAPIIRLINAILAEAIRDNASDVHIETFERDLIVRFRVDGVLREVVRPKRALAALLVSRIKVMARLDIAEKRVPQDGRTTLRIGGREVDVRVSTLPSANGERVVLRLLDKQAGKLDLAHLGMDHDSLTRMRELVSRPHGIVLVTGPTGSGKTTTLYASLGEVRSDALNVITVEDPIEYNLPGIGQTQVNNKAGMTFARGLRAILRQDPDVVMVGEIRDKETAEIAIQAAQTGHLVLSTLHTNTAIGAVSRLRDIGVEPYLLSSSLTGVIAQRLVRVLCPECRRPTKPTPMECSALELSEDDVVYEPVGCDACGGTGFRGRTGVYEVIRIEERLRELVHDGVSELELEREAHARSRTLVQDGRRKVLDGATSVAEVLRVSRED